MIIVNALGGLDNPNTEATDPLLLTGDEIAVDARSLADAHASGLGAVNITLGYVMGDHPPYEHTLAEIAAWDRVLAAHPDDLRKVRTAAELRLADGRIGVIYGFQNGVALGDDLGRVQEFADLGVRVIQLTYNPANHLGGGSMDPADPGLTPFGHDAVAALGDARVMVDLSHSGQATCLQAARAARFPVSINHTGCRALADLPRNKTDEELRLVADRGGFVGIYFMPYLRPDGRPTADDVVAHLGHAVNVCGEDHVGIGTDGPITPIDDLDAYRATLAEHVAARATAGVGATGETPDTFPFVVDLRGVDQFRRLIGLLERRGWTAARIEKVMGRNFIAYAERIWG